MLNISTRLDKGSIRLYRVLYILKDLKYSKPCTVPIVQGFCKHLIPIAEGTWREVADLEAVNGESDTEKLARQVVDNLHAAIKIEEAGKLKIAVKILAEQCYTLRVKVRKMLDEQGKFLEKVLKEGC